MKHTPEPWQFKDTEMKITGTGDLFCLQVIANVTPKMDFAKGMGTQCANAARIVACVNACAGMDDPAKYMEGVTILEKTYHDLQAEKAILRNERDELLAALENLIAWANIKDGSPSQQLRDDAMTAITKAKGVNP
jgi:hypothetical protein